MRDLNICFKSSIKKITSLLKNADPPKNVLCLMFPMMFYQNFNIMPNTFYDIDQSKLSIQVLKGAWSQFVLQNSFLL